MALALLNRRGRGKHFYCSLVAGGFFWTWQSSQRICGQLWSVVGFSPRQAPCSDGAHRRRREPVCQAKGLSAEARVQGPATCPEFSGCKQQTLIQGNVGRDGVYGEDMSQVEWGIRNQAWTRARSIFSVSWGGSWDGGPVAQGVPHS